MVSIARAPSNGTPLARLMRETVKGRATMRRLLLAICLLCVPLNAAATPELAAQWGYKAADLHAETSDLISQIDQGELPTFNPEFLYEVERFAINASRLGHWIEQTGSAPDLGCIFRGMAAEGELQLEALDTSSGQGETRAALRRLASMFADAEVIAVASSRRTYVATGRSKTAPAACPASAEAALYALR